MYKNSENGKGGKLGIVLTIVVLIIIVILTNTKTDGTNFLEKGITNIVMPIQNGLTYLKNKMANNNTFFEDIEKLKEENENLKNTNSDLEQTLREFEIMKAENNTLKEYLQLKEKYPNYTTVPADIIDKDISNISSTFVINVGSNDGIMINMTVIADKGLVGHIISVTENTAKVQPIIDTASTVSATVTNEKDSVIIRGYQDVSKNYLKATYIPIDTDLIQGESVETSGLGGIYQKGIHIGSIKEIVQTKNNTDRYAIVEPAVDFSKLDTVLVIVK